MILGSSAEVKRSAVKHGQDSLAAGQSWTELDTEEEIELGYAGVVDIDRVLAEHPWLRVCESIASVQGFFHWQLDFAPIFAGSGGFDLQEIHRGFAPILTKPRNLLSLMFGGR
jgi:hypothetical protein